MTRWGNPLFDYFALGHDVWMLGGHILVFYILGLLLLAFLLMAGLFFLYELFAWLDVYREVRRDQDRADSVGNDSSV